MRAHAKRQQGMTLVEVLVAFAILAGVIVSVMALISQNTRYIITAEERLLAEVLADNLLTADLAHSASPGEGIEEGEARIASRTFVYQRRVAHINAGVVQIEYTIKPAERPQELASAMALRGE